MHKYIICLTALLLPCMAMTKNLCHCPTFASLSHGLTIKEARKSCTSKVDWIPIWESNTQKEKINPRQVGGKHIAPIKAYKFLGASLIKNKVTPDGGVNCFYETKKGSVVVVMNGLTSVMPRHKFDKWPHIVSRPYGSHWIKNNKETTYICKSSNPRDCAFSNAANNR